MLRPKVNSRLKGIFKFFIFFHNISRFFQLLHILGILYSKIRQSCPSRCPRFHFNNNNNNNNNFKENNHLKILVYISTISDINTLRNRLPVDCVQFAMWATAMYRQYSFSLISFSRCLRLLLRPHPPSVFPSVNCFIRHFLRKM